MAKVIFGYEIDKKMSNDRTQDQDEYLKIEQEDVQALDMHKIPSLKLWSMLIVVTALSQFHRNALGVMAPDLMRDFGISPSLLGTVGSMFAIATALAQIDKFAIRSTVTGLLAIATLGVVVEVFAYSGEGVAVARFILGVGCAATGFQSEGNCAHSLPALRHRNEG